MQQEKRLRMEEDKLIMREEEKRLQYENERKKRGEAIMNSDHMKASRARFAVSKRSEQRSGEANSYYWTNAYAEKKRRCSSLPDPDMSEKLKFVTPWVEV